jgi:hypothetical protein
MMTRLGKILVLVTTALSWTLAVLVYGAYTQAIDWGWKDPRKDIEKRPIPSEKAKREQLVGAARAAAERSQAALHVARAQLHAARLQYPQNHLWYNKILKTLKDGDGQNTIPVSDIQLDPKGQMVLSAPVIGMPGFTKPLPGLTMPEDKQRSELQDLLGQMGVQMEALKKLYAEQKVVTERLSPPKGVKGLNDLAEVEAQTQARLKEEMARLRPNWARELAEAQTLLERRDSLRRRLEELQQKGKTVSLAP